MMAMSSNHVNIICNNLFHSQAYAGDINKTICSLELCKDGNPCNDHNYYLNSVYICNNDVLIKMSLLFFVLDFS